MGICTLYTVSTPWNSTECSWMNADETTPWDTPGGDYGPSFITTEAAVAGEIETFDVTEFVNNIINGSADNNGFIITPGTSPDLTLQMQDHIYYSSEYDDVSKRPALVLDDGVIPIVDPINLMSQNIAFSYDDMTVQIAIPSLKNQKVSLYDVHGKHIATEMSIDGKVKFQVAGKSKQVILLKVSNMSFPQALKLYLP